MLNPPVSVMLNPPVDGSVADSEAALCRHFFQVSIAQRVPGVPTQTKTDDLSFEMAELKSLGWLTSKAPPGRIVGQRLVNLALADLFRRVFYLCDAITQRVRRVTA